MVAVFLLTLYAAAGVAFFWYFDRQEMKKEVPYGDCPAIFSLGVMRKTVLATCVVIGTGTLVVLVLELVAEMVLQEFKLRMAVFRLNRVLKLVGVKKRVRLGTRQKLTWK